MNAFSAVCGDARRILACLAASALAGCSIVPGNQAYGEREESAVRLPVQQGDVLAPANVRIKPITAELIIDLFKAARPPRGDGTSSVAVASKANLGPTAGASKPVPDYRLGPGDIISIVVWDHPELTIPAGSFRTAEQAGTVVAEDGTIFYPYAGVLKVQDKTTSEVRTMLSAKLTKYIEKVQLDVRMVAFRSKQVYVVGEVAKPGVQPVTDVPMTVLEAINRAGGLTPEADHSRVLLTRRGQTYLVDIQAMYDQGSTEQNALLEHGDILNVADRSYNKVFVLGEVNKPGSLMMNKKRLTLAEALGDVGYISQASADPRWIYVMRGDTETPELFHLDSRLPDAMLLADRFPLRPRDIVYVDAAAVVRWQRVIANILPTATMLNQTSLTQYPLFGGRQP
ncbi:MAG TPA: polysaccharide biosynthesis/export family protein [Accumulibacter sp.]|uniref:polysaccharide biosynthesis/export family protein n=1 Tax=Accumulibacter sp. TaxID=2053492 RepID=UPI002878BB43|nr:polysaccharide biosynthesis/export family protein [Accumulibacter sp.]MDS4053472.1 polysaccharide biosynthesis/export family protein [Accumulibacter sp.]HMW62708.1 polysaccharide biosynthesis/export family protein [Accumulibacter sp.]HMW79082.1 polysaccharide biosynthesis/export family protein [Accumulibacter sp.]HMX69003.1 polysaccharide biosynthesis/export family protein [Accumulibacter sp.]HNB67168.1 polysaccharide biosynthesis/export family protein [Accumulibacter sp.]